MRPTLPAGSPGRQRPGDERAAHLPARRAELGGHRATGPAAAREFYGGLLGWTFEDGWVAPAGDGPGRWHVTFSVADRDDAAARTEALGGRVLASEDTEWTRTALVRDPQGAELTLSQFTPPAER